VKNGNEKRQGRWDFPDQDSAPGRKVPSRCCLRFHGGCKQQREREGFFRGCCRAAFPPVRFSFHLTFPRPVKNGNEKARGSSPKPEASWAAASWRPWTSPRLTHASLVPPPANRCWHSRLPPESSAAASTPPRSRASKSASSKTALITPRPSPTSATTSSAAAETPPYKSWPPGTTPVLEPAWPQKRRVATSARIQARKPKLILQALPWRGASGLAWALAQAASGPPPAIQGRTMPLPSRSSKASPSHPFRPTCHLSPPDDTSRQAHSTISAYGYFSP
jgi:hypothetical protein